MKKTVNDFYKDVTKLGLGVILAQFIGFLFYPIISRIYAPEDFGLFSLFASIISVLTIIGTASYEFAIPLSKSKDSAISLLVNSISLTIALIILLLSFDLLFSFSKIDDSIGDIKYLLFIGLLVSSAVSIKTQFHTYHKTFGKLSLAKVLQTSIVGITQIIYGTIKPSVFGLIIGFIIGRIAFLITGSKKIYEAIYKGIDSVKLINSLQEFNSHPKFVLPSSLISSFTRELPIFLILPFFGQTILGFYAFAFRVAVTPVFIVASSISSVYYKKLVDKISDHERISPFIVKLWVALFYIGLIPFTLLFIYGKPFFIFVFGAEWASSGEIAGLLSIMLFSRFIFLPTSKSFLALKAQKYMPIFSFSILLITFLCFYYGYIYIEFIDIVLVYSVSISVIHFIQIGFIFFWARKHDRELS